MAIPSELPTVVLQTSKPSGRRDVRLVYVTDVALERRSTLVLDTCLWEGESSVEGYTMLERVRKSVEKEGVSYAGELHLYLVLKQRKKIPTEWWKFKLLFPGTVVRCLNGGLVVPCLYRIDGKGKYYDEDQYLVSPLDNSFRLVRLESM